jgi:hypothetical protein
MGVDRSAPFVKGRWVKEDIMRQLLLTCTGLLCLQIAMTSVAQAADHNFCERYARVAREQLEVARERCRHRIDLRNPRWGSSREEHYRWCRSVPYREAEREREHRHNEIERCRG